MTVLHPLSRSVLALALIAAFATSAPTTQAQSAADSGLPRGHFYTQAGGDTPRPDDGFLVADRPGFGFTSGRNFVRFWSEFERYGGVAILGYPASRPFVFDGFDVQAFQKGILQWRPDAGPDGRAWAMNVLDEFTRRGLDGRLLAEKQVPLPGRYEDDGKSFDQITRVGDRPRRMGERRARLPSALGDRSRRPALAASHGASRITGQCSRGRSARADPDCIGPTASGSARRCCCGCRNRPECS
ncbi:MAG TPA: hypothetical protein VGE94_15640 [Chloroflexota bacterium]